MQLNRIYSESQYLGKEITVHIEAYNGESYDQPGFIKLMVTARGSEDPVEAHWVLVEPHKADCHVIRQAMDLFDTKVSDFREIVDCEVK